MSSTPLVSVIVPFLDVAPFLAEAIESVRAQTYANWELLLCNDGSTDGSTDIARAYAQVASIIDAETVRHQRQPLLDDRVSELIDALDRQIHESSSLRTQ